MVQVFFFVFGSLLFILRWEDFLVKEATGEPPGEKNQQIWGEGLAVAIHVLLPLAIAGVLWGRKIILSKILLHLDKACLSVFWPSFSKREKVLKWAMTHLPYLEGGLETIWTDGAQLCTLINSVVPGACPNPHRHWKKPPTHGQALAYKYLGVVPVFTDSDFNQKSMNSTIEKTLIEYMTNVQNAVSKISHDEELTFSNNYIARGMGLVTGEQYRKTVLYIYPNNKNKQSDNLLINIRGPYNSHGVSILYANDLAALYKSIRTSEREREKIVDEDAHKSFLKTLTGDFQNLLSVKYNREQSCDIDISIEIERNRAKVMFIPRNSGVYEVCLTTNGEHIAGSPYNINVEKNRSGIMDDLSEDESKGKSKKRIIPKIIETPPDNKHAYIKYEEKEKWRRMRKIRDFTHSSESSNNTSIEEDICYLTIKKDEDLNNNNNNDEEVNNLNKSEGGEVDEEAMIEVELPMKQVLLSDLNKIKFPNVENQNNPGVISKEAKITTVKSQDIRDRIAALESSVSDKKEGNNNKPKIQPLRKKPSLTLKIKSAEASDDNNNNVSEEVKNIKVKSCALKRIDDFQKLIDSNKPETQKKISGEASEKSKFNEPSRSLTSSTDELSITESKISATDDSSKSQNPSTTVFTDEFYLKSNIAEISSTKEKLDKPNEITDSKITTIETDVSLKTHNLVEHPLIKNQSNLKSATENAQQSEIDELPKLSSLESNDSINDDDDAKIMKCLSKNDALKHYSDENIHKSSMDLSSNRSRNNSERIENENKNQNIIELSVDTLKFCKGSNENIIKLSIDTFKGCKESNESPSLEEVSLDVRLNVDPSNLAEIQSEIPENNSVPVSHNFVDNETGSFTKSENYMDKPTKITTISHSKPKIIDRHQHYDNEVGLNSTKSIGFSLKSEIRKDHQQKNESFSHTTMDDHKEATDDVSIRESQKMTSDELEIEDSKQKSACALKMDNSRDDLKRLDFSSGDSLKGIPQGSSVEKRIQRLANLGRPPVMNHGKNLKLKMFTLKDETEGNVGITETDYALVDTNKSFLKSIKTDSNSDSKIIVDNIKSSPKNSQVNAYKNENDRCSSKELFPNRLEQKIISNVGDLKSPLVMKTVVTGSASSLINDCVFEVGPTNKSREFEATLAHDTAVAKLSGLDNNQTALPSRHTNIDLKPNHIEEPASPVFQNTAPEDLPSNPKIQVSDVSSENIKEAPSGKGKLHKWKPVDEPENTVTEDENLDLRLSFMKRKEFWSKISNTSTNSLNSSCLSLNFDNFDRRYSSLSRLQVKKPKLVSSYNLREMKAINPQQFRSLDFIDKRRIHRSDSFGIRDRYGSLDDLYFPSVKERRGVFLKEMIQDEVKHVGSVEKQVKPATRELIHKLEEKASPAGIRSQEVLMGRRKKNLFGSIHDKIKLFDSGFSSANKRTTKPQEVNTFNTALKENWERKLNQLPENGTIKTKIKERFEKAQMFFKTLENVKEHKHEQSLKTSLMRRHSLGSNTVKLEVIKTGGSLRNLSISERLPLNTLSKDYRDDVGSSNSLFGSFSSNGDGKCVDYEELKKLQVNLFLMNNNKKKARKSVHNVFN